MPRERIFESSEPELRALFGPMDRHLRAIRERYGVRITARGRELTLEGDDAGIVRDVTRRVRRVLDRVRQGGDLSEEEVEGMLLDGRAAGPDAEGAPRGFRPGPPPGRDAPHGSPGARASHGPQGRSPGRPFKPGHGPAPNPAGVEVQPRTPMQQRYVRAIQTSDVVVAIGPAGTGKTYLAVAEAVASLRANQVRKIVLTRPAVEAGEKLGFLPGDFHAKINPYLRPLYDALGELLAHGEVQRYLDADVIEIVPLAYMRGRTLKSAFIILDEGQNTTPAQMKMFLTRMGEGSKVVLTGDVTQVDLPEGQPSGLIDAVRILDGTPGLEIIRFDVTDIQRHAVVQRIVDAYDRDDRLRRGERGPPGAGA